MRRMVSSVTCLAFLLTLVPLVRAQQEEPAPPPPPPAPQQQQATNRPAIPYGPEAMYRSGRGQRKVGMILTFVAIGIGALGLAMIYDANNNRSSDLDYAFEKGFGIVFSITGAGLLIPGVFLWANGASMMDEALQRGAPGMSLAPAPRVAAAPGLTLQWRF